MYLFLIISVFISLFLCNVAGNDRTEISIPPQEIPSITLEQGEQKVVLNISVHNESLLNESLQVGPCTGWCLILDKINLTTTSCESVRINLFSSVHFIREQINIRASLQSIKITPEYKGEWKCSFSLRYSNNTSWVVYEQPLLVTVNGGKTSMEIWIIVVIAVSACVFIIIIGQTICILYFKSKAKRAEIDKNLTPKNTGDLDMPDSMRYIHQNNGSNETTRNSVIYETLGTVQERAPIPPSIETLPGKPFSHEFRSASHSNLGHIPETEQTRTTPRPQVKIAQHPKKSHTIDDKFSSLERIQSRRPMPLPTEEDYEYPVYQSKIPEKSPLLTDATSSMQKKSLFGQSAPLEPPAPLSQRAPYSPAVTRNPSIGRPAEPSPTWSRKAKPPTGHPLPGPSGRPPGQTPMAQNLMPGPARPSGSKGAMLILPSMIKNAVLKPVPTQLRAPVANPSRMTPEPSVARPTPAHSNSLGPNLRPVPNPKPKPPVPLPEQYVRKPDYLDEPEYYHESSDEEFDCYEELPEYRIYGNAPPKKFK